MDIGTGGCGMRTHQFLPRMCEGTLFILEPEPAGGGAPERSAGARVVLEHPVKVRRVTMVGHEPTYFVGLSFVDPDPELQRKIEELLSRASDADAEPAAEGGDG